MNSFNWGETYLTGIIDVDDQHHHLVNLINQLGQLIVDDNISLDELEKLIKKLISYASYHFKDEEKMMEQKGIDPRHLKTHISIHSRFISEIEFLSNNISEDCRKSAKQLFEFLVHWLSYHILGSDQDMARQLECIESGLTPEQAYDQEESRKNDSTKPLLEALTRLFEMVSERNKELIKLNLSLENKVEERTQELSKVNQHLEEISMTDALTALPNRRHAMRSLENFWQQAQNSSSDMSCMMIDADHFKEINDKYGHDAGDEVLVRLAKTLQGAVRTDDIVCRLGGDEFLVICPNTGNSGAVHIANTIHQAISALHISVGEGVWHGSISVGVASKNEQISSFQALLKAADILLYKAKRDGKNCVRFAS